jgi:hypothetical protein
METYEFYAKPQNGTIMIPERFRRKIKSDVKVILLEQSPRSTGERNKKSVKKSEMLLAPSIATKGWKFDREAANER